MGDLDSRTQELTEVRDDIEQAEEAIRVYRERIDGLEQENDAYNQRYD